MKVIFKVILKSWNKVSLREQRGGVGLNWEKYCVGLFNVSEHVDHFKAMKYFCEKKREIVRSGSTAPN